VHLVRLADCAPQPWRNGGGTTRELLRWPQHAGDPSSWRLRISVAEIERDGPFSPFAEVERWFAVLQGAGVRLAGIDGDVTAGAAPVHFAGEAAPMCHLLAGPTRDLNLMHRRGAGRATMRRARTGERLEGSGACRSLYVHEPARIDTGTGPHELEAATLLWSDVPSASAWLLLDAGVAYWMSVAP
jgi:hypothetical protein